MRLLRRCEWREGEGVRESIGRLTEEGEGRNSALLSSAKERSKQKLWSEKGLLVEAFRKREAYQSSSSLETSRLNLGIGANTVLHSLGSLTSPPHNPPLTPTSSILHTPSKTSVLMSSVVDTASMVSSFVTTSAPRAEGVKETVERYS